MDSYLENAMDYAQEVFESANEWMKENDPFPLLVGVNAQEGTYICSARSETVCTPEWVYDCNHSPGSGLSPGSNCGTKLKQVCREVQIPCDHPSRGR